MCFIPNILFDLCCQRHTDRRKVLPCDVLIAGPSCVNFSLENENRKRYARCYSTGEGESGYTYQHGYRDPHKVEGAYKQQALCQFMFVLA